MTLEEGEGIANCFNVRYFPDDQYLVIATRQGIIKKTALSAYGRPMKGGIIAIRLDDGDALVDVRIVQGEKIWSCQLPAVWRSLQPRRRPPDGPATRGVKGIKLKKDEIVVGMVVADLIAHCSASANSATANARLSDLANWIPATTLRKNGL